MKTQIYSIIFILRETKHYYPLATLREKLQHTLNDQDTYLNFVESNNTIH